MSFKRSTEIAQIMAMAALAGMPGIERLFPPQAKPHIITPEDERRQQKAQEKRGRKAAKRIARNRNAS